jgi:putative ABC transport system ATP-binding protein
LVPELPVLDNIALPLLLAGQRRSSAVRAARPWLAQLGLEALAKRRPSALSGGESQRVAIARALVARPRVVFADEPTGCLDSVAADSVMDLLVGTARQSGAAVVLVTHEPRVAACADRTVLVRDGRVVDSVPPAVPQRPKPNDHAGLVVETGPVDGPIGEVLP